MQRFAIAVAVLLLAVWSAAAEDLRDRLGFQLREMLNDGEWAIDRGLLKDAKARLEAGDAALAKQDPAYAAWRTRTMLARVYLESEQFGRARALAEQSKRQLAGLPRRDEQQILRDRQTVELLLADVEAALADRAASLRRPNEAQQHVAAQTQYVRSCLAIPNGLRLVDTAWELRVLRRLAELEQSQNHAAQAADAWRRLQQQATLIRDRLAPRAAPGPDYVPAEPLLVAMRSLAAAHAAQNRPADAVAALAPLVKLPLEAAIRVRVLAEIAEVYGQARDYPHERDYLVRAVEVEAARKESDPAKVAQLHVRIAQSWDAETQSQPRQPQQPAAQQRPSQPHWVAAAKSFEAAMRAKLAVKEEKDDPQRAVADAMLYLQQLQAIYQHLEQYPDAERIAQQLHDLRAARLLPDDPRIYRSKSSWGSYLVHNLVENRQHAAAAKLLDDAGQYWSTRNPPEPDVQVRTWIARAEIHRADGEIRSASDLLDRAEAQCVKYGGQLVSDKVRMSLCVNRGLVLAEQGLYQRAVESYTQALALGERLGPAAGELRASALVNLAMVYKSQLQFEQARALCDQALADRLRVLSPTDLDVLPYYIASAGLDIAAAGVNIIKTEPDVALRNIAALEQSVQKSWDLCVANKIEREAQPNVAAVWHQRAMVHYIKNEQATSAAERQAAREAFQQSLSLEERLASADSQARTLHYLAKLKFADFREALSAWKNRDAQNDPDYAVHFKEFLAHKADFEKRTAEYKDRVEGYETRLAAHEQAVVSKTATAAEFDNLKRLREDLSQQRDKLATEHAALAAEEQAAQQRYAAAKESQHDETYRRLDGQLRDAQSLAAQSVDLLDRSGVFPNLHYAALCNQGQILWALSEWHGRDEIRRNEYQNKAVAQLGRAVQLTETPRSMTTGGDIARAEFFSNYATAFDLLVDWHTRLNQPAEALRYAEMGRNRTFLDQIRASEFDLRDTIPADKKDLLDREQQLLKQHGEKMARARTLARKPATEITPAETQELLAAKDDLEALRVQYVKVRDEIYAASPRYNGLARAEIKSQDVSEALAKLSSPRHPLLYYYVGSGNSHLFVVAGDARGIDHYELEIPQGPGAEVLARSRRVPAPVLRELVDRYRDVISGKDSSQALLRGPWKSADALVVKGRAKLSYAALTDVLLPAAARDKVRSLEADYVTIVPDGPLHHLPFEALPLTDAYQKKFLFDVFPALAYAPSVMILKTLSEHTDGKAAAGQQPGGIAASRAALTLGDPEFQGRGKPAPSQVTLAVANIPIERRYVESGADFPPLKFAKDESQNVQATFQQAFGAGNVVSLVGPDATEGRLRAELAKRRFSYVHLATHGYVDEGVFNLFGAIMLAPPKDGGLENPLDDGQLRLYEISALQNLSDCQLAVLSACQTNIGPARPMETGSTFARAFLSAGVRRVVSSQWSVEDESTATLIKPFFRSVVESLDRPAAPLNYAQALRTARQGIRSDPRWQAPCYWAPFVLVGPAE